MDLLTMATIDAANNSCNHEFYPISVIIGLILTVISIYYVEHEHSINKKLEKFKSL